MRTSETTLPTWVDHDDKLFGGNQMDCQSYIQAVYVLSGQVINAGFGTFYPLDGTGFGDPDEGSGFGDSYDGVWCGDGFSRSMK